MYRNLQVYGGTSWDARGESMGIFHLLEPGGEEEYSVVGYGNTKIEIRLYKIEATKEDIEQGMGYYGKHVRGLNRLIRSLGFEGNVSTGDLMGQIGKYSSRNFQSLLAMEEENIIRKGEEQDSRYETMYASKLGKSPIEIKVKLDVVKNELITEILNGDERIEISAPKQLIDDTESGYLGYYLERINRIIRGITYSQ